MQILVDKFPGLLNVFPATDDAVQTDKPRRNQITMRGCCFGKYADGGCSMRCTDKSSWSDCSSFLDCTSTATAIDRCRARNSSLQQQKSPRVELCYQFTAFHTARCGCWSFDLLEKVHEHYSTYFIIIFIFLPMFATRTLGRQALHFSRWTQTRCVSTLEGNPHIVSDLPQPESSMFLY